MAKQRTRISGQDRREELVQIAYRHIAQRGFEGLRVRDVAAEAQINNATLHYYFPTKEALIQGVVEKLIQGFSTMGEVESAPPETALQAIRREFEDARQRLSDPDQFVVFTELLIRSRRDTAIAAVFSQLDENWHRYLVSIIERGIESGEFRSDLDPASTATLIMAVIKGFGFQILGETVPEQARADAETVSNQIEMQVEAWLTRGR
jgi:AcrR family transcriptional regulator